MKYKIKSIVNTRKGMKVADYRIGKKQFYTNRVGQYQPGQIVDVHETQTDGKNWEWARVSEPDAAGVSVWFCVYDGNRQFAERMDEPNEPEAPSALSLDERVARIEKKLGIV